MSGWQPVPGTVYIVGGGPGDPDLMTVRARTVLAAAQTVLYADSLVDPQLFGTVADTAAVRGTSGMTLEPIVAELVAAARRGEIVARVHSGDPGIYGAIAEQLVRLDEAGVPWEVIPGVPSPMAAAAALGCELTVPEVSQSVVFCRVAGRTPIPEGQDLRALARPGVSLCVFLSTAYAAELVGALRAGGVPEDTPAVIAERVSWPDERISPGTVADLEDRLRVMAVRRHALVLVGPAFARATGRLRSALYSADHAHVFRPAGEGAAGVRRNPEAVGVYALTAAGAAVAARIAACVEGASLHLPERLAAAHPGAVAQAGAARAVVPRLLAGNGAVVLVMATGAAVRLVAPHLADKHRDPAVVAVDDAGRFAVPLTGAHAGGANRLARRVAAVLGATPVVTTASDGRAWPAPDELARERGWRVAEPDATARLTTALLDGDPVGYVQNAGRPLADAGDWPATLHSCDDLESLRAQDPAAAWVITDSAVDPEPGWTVMHPPTLVLGVGCESGVERGEVETAVDRALAAAGLSPLSVAVVATLDRKTEETGLVAAAAARGWPLRGFAAEALRTQGVPTPSAVVEAAVGTPSVAEAAALLGAGEGGRLAAAKQVCGRVTVAVAQRRCR